MIIKLSINQKKRATLKELEQERAKIKRAMKRTNQKGYYQDLEMALDTLNEEIESRYLS